ncbi:hypothetical protein [Psychrobacillus sp. OK032]|uniref:hypothetical protein n=1 Tax=Psychrobacillus sp. OK032 TaxID=1884358 RepID=UPI0008C112BF|nr:hypothetical protein [Psychrobacillus sp. OK032]SER88188.1 hypothetical protein SAMN05518872_102480 [Psychrobacillus sp. OK032]
MTKIILTHEIVKENIPWENEFEFEGETYVNVEQEEDMDDDGRDFTVIYKRKSDGKHFRITRSDARWGYEDYGYEAYMNDCELTEVEQVEVITTVWKAVK